MLKQLKAKMMKRYRQMAEAQPGERFMDQYERRQEKAGKGEAKWRGPIFISGGILLFVIGLLLSIPPGVPGFLLWVPALGLIVARSYFLANLFDRSEIFINKLIQKLPARLRPWEKQKGNQS